VCHAGLPSPRFFAFQITYGKAECNSPVSVHVQDIRGRPADRSQAANNAAFDGEMLVPGVRSWIEQPSELGTRRVQSGEVWAFVEVAVPTGECQVVRLIAATVGPSHNVFDLETVRVVPLGKPAILAPLSCTVPNGKDRLVVH